MLECKCPDFAPQLAFIMGDPNAYLLYLVKTVKKGYWGMPAKYCCWCGALLIDTEMTQPFPSLEDTQRIPGQFEQVQQSKQETYLRQEKYWTRQGFRMAEGLHPDLPQEGEER